MRQFDHEKLTVYQRSIEFVAWSNQLLESVPRKFSINDQLDRASTSIPLNIAEGNGKFTAKDRCRFVDIARGSTFESAACLDVLVAKGITTTEETCRGKEMLLDTVSMLAGLIRSNSEGRTI